MDTLIELFSQAQGWFFETLVQPAMFELGLAGFLDQGYDGTGWFLVGLLQLLVMVLVIGPLERWRPVEAVSDRATVRTDVLYTLIHRLGLFRLVSTSQRCLQPYLLAECLLKVFTVPQLSRQ